jgi:hypothetical protein
LVFLPPEAKDIWYWLADDDIVVPQPFRKGVCAKWRRNNQSAAQALAHASAPKTAVLQLTHSWKFKELHAASLHTPYHTSAIIMLYTHMRAAVTAQPLCHAEELMR